MSVNVDINNCIGCGVCLEVCRFQAFIPAGKGNYTIDYHPEKCKDCKKCLVKIECLGECVT